MPGNTFRRQLIGLSSLVIMSQGLIQCSSERKAKDQGPGLSSIASQPYEEARFLASIQLRQAALFQSAKIDPKDGRVILNASSREALEREQKEFLDKVAFISPEIKLIYQYRFVLNGLVLSVPNKYRDRFQEMAETSSLGIVEPRLIERAPEEQEAVDRMAMWGASSSVAFIQAKKVQEELGIRGQGMRVGVIDTGIDYTHKMFGGKGTVAVYKANDPATLADDFPTPKVVGGYDFVGGDFDSGSDVPWNRFPTPDPDPIDESGHGSHVAGTIAGRGDNTETYDGVAPDAALYALKVFGRDGSTNDAVVIAALEYAADPNQDGDPSDRLDAVNLSLGGGYGVPDGLYDEAVANLTRGGTVAVISAGNSGNVPYIVGSPSTSAAALSVAASVDSMDHNWRERASEVLFSDGTRQLVPMVPGSIAPSPIGFSSKELRLVDVGLALTELTLQQKLDVLGAIALISRGENSFCDKGKRAQDAGALAFVVINNVAGRATAMGGDCTLNIPGTMVTQAVGAQLRADPNARMNLDAGTWIEDPSRIDTLTGFTSRGPRSLDGAFKPEITAPGQAIISAAVGSGFKGTRMSGTSMAAPHMAGVVALIKQKFPGISNSELKSRVMNSAVTLYEVDNKKEAYPLTRQGAGRIDTHKALTLPITLDPPVLSLGHVLVDQNKGLLSRVTIKNQTDEEQIYRIEAVTDSELVLQDRGLIRLLPREQRTIQLPLEIRADIYNQNTRELDGFLRFVDQKATDKTVVAQLPVLAVLKRVAQVEASRLQVYSSSSADAAGALASLQLENKSQTVATALPFLPLGQDERKSGILQNPSRSNLCDLQEAGYRIIDRTEGDGTEAYLEVASKLYQPITTWNLCSQMVLIDTNLDGKVDASIDDGVLTWEDTPQTVSDVQLASWIGKRQRQQDDRDPLLAQLNSVRALRAEPLAEDESKPAQAWKGLETFEYSTLAIQRAPLASLGLFGQRELGIRVIVYARTESADNVDALASAGSDPWRRIALQQQDMSWRYLPDRVTVRPQDVAWLDFEGGFGAEDLLIFVPENPSNVSLTGKDRQSLQVKPEFSF
jgi:minor extracellular serine protease Vpr